MDVAFEMGTLPRLSFHHCRDALCNASNVFADLVVYKGSKTRVTTYSGKKICVGQCGEVDFFELSGMCDILFADQVRLFVIYLGGYQ